MAEEENGHVISPDFRDYFFSALDEQRKENSFCDVTVIVGGERFPAHKAVLGIVSSYFKAMFTSNFAEATSSEVTIEGNSDAFRRLLDFAYSGDLYLTPEVLVDVTQMACYLQFTQALLMCTAGLEKLHKHCQMNTETAFQAYVVAQNYGLELEPMINETSDFLTVNFAQFCQTEAFLKDVSPEYLEHFLNRNDLTALSDEMSEEKVLKAVTSWLKHDWVNRRMFAERLLKKIRLGVIPISQLSVYFTNEMKTEPGCKKLLGGILDGQAEFDGSNQEMFTRRGVPVLMSIRPGTSSHFVEYYNTRTRHWTKGFPNINGTRGQNRFVIGESITMCRDIPISLNCSNGQLYVGMRRDNRFRNFVQFNESTRRWNQLPVMRKPFSGCSIVYTNDYLYAVGGCSTDSGGGEVMYGCEVRRFSIEAHIWEELPPIPSREATSLLSPVVLPFLGKLFVYAAIATHTRGLFMYNPANRSWTNFIKCVREPQVPRFVIKEGKLYRILRPKIIDAHYKLIIHQVIVHDISTNEPSVQLHKEQDCIANKLGLFFIKNGLFLDLNGYIHELELTKEQWRQGDRYNMVSLIYDHSTRSASQADLGIQVHPVFGKHTFERVQLSMNLPRK